MCTYTYVFVSKCKIKIGSHPNVVIGTRHSGVERMLKNKTLM